MAKKGALQAYFGKKKGERVGEGESGLKRIMNLAGALKKLRGKKEK